MKTDELIAIDVHTHVGALHVQAAFKTFEMSALEGHRNENRNALDRTAR
jgi:hypothetical protein